MNADRTIYGRFGSRSDQQNAEKDISIDGFRHALAGGFGPAQELPAEQTVARGKQPKPVAIKSPEQYPELAGKCRRSTTKVRWFAVACTATRCAKPNGPCIARNESRSPDEVLLPYPMPDAVGLFHRSEIKSASERGERRQRR